LKVALSPSSEIRVLIESDRDIVSARQKGRELAAALGFSSTEQTLIATAISEVARNIVSYAKRGEVILSRLDQEGRNGILVVAQDQGPGIADLELAMRDGYSTGKSLGMGLPGARRLMDEFQIVSAPEQGTAISMKKWLR
jgi:serine/threonine-protein kinase RsbT